MQLDNISTVVRPRSAWESIDLGMLMARAWWWPLWRAWLALTLPAFLVLQLLLYSYPSLAIILFWWLKPVWERPLLHILSHAMFGELPPLKQTLHAFPKLAARQWFASLTYRRLSLTRSMDLPVIQLENLKGKQRAQRLKVLHGNTGTGAGWLTFIGVHVETTLPFAFLALVVMMVPAEVEMEWQSIFFSEEQGMMWLFNLLSYAVMSLVAPFYVAAGFSLYLNRRIRLEGWDIELTFRRLVQRAQTQNGLGKVAALLVAALLACGWQPDAAMAQTLEREQAKSQIETIMADETFHDMDTVRSLDWDWSSEPEEGGEFPAWLVELVGYLAANLRLLFWVLVIALVLIFLYKQRDWLLQYVRPGSEAVQEAPPTVLFGMEVGSDTLPADVLAEVQSLWRQQQFRAAYSLLYRAALNRLMHDYSIRFRSGYTEEECRRLVLQQTGSELGDYFSELTRHWQRLAYAHQPPADDIMATLCERWPYFFQPGALDG